MRQQPLKRTPLIIALVVVVADQITKLWAVAELSDGPIPIIDGVLRFALHRNPGAAFSILQDSGVVLAFVGMVIVVAMVWMLPGLEGQLERNLVGLVLGGAVGNLVDRAVRGTGVFDGAVVDFIDFSFWPTFNIADSAISVGIVMIMALGFVRR